MSNDKKTQPTIIVIFGGTGDLAKRKLIPAFYNLFLDDHMPDKFFILGLGRSELTTDEYAEHLKEGLNKFSRRGKPASDQWEKFKSSILYQQLNINEESCYQKLAEKLACLDEQMEQRANRLFYLSVAPQFIDAITSNLNKYGVASNALTDRIIIEKPFGNNKESAVELNRLLTQTFHEKQIYRIDHYLGKETVQNILALRFANALFEPLWNRNYIDSVQINVAEQVGVEDRGGYYEGAGALRDMIQNHLLQILCMVAMEPPLSFEAEEVRNKKVDVLRAIRRMKPAEVHDYAVRGQYMDGWIQGMKVRGYRDEPSVNANSNTETFAALKLYIDNWRWQGVPFYLRTGKRMTEKTSSITIEFRPVPHSTFPAEKMGSLLPNRLTINIQPHMDIAIRFVTKKTGLEMDLQPAQMLFDYDKSSTQSPEAYETLLLDAMRGDAPLFMRADQVEEAWDVITPVLQAWESRPALDFPNYAAGTRGPEASETLIAREGHVWAVNGHMLKHSKAAKNVIASITTC